MVCWNEARAPEFLVGHVGELVELTTVRVNPGGVMLVDFAQPVLKRRVMALLLVNRVVVPPHLSLPLHKDQPYLLIALFPVRYVDVRRHQRHEQQQRRHESREAPHYDWKVSGDL